MEEEVVDVLGELDQVLKKVYSSAEALLLANKPTKGSVEDLTDNALALNMALHRLQVLTEKQQQMELAGAVGGRRVSGDR